jgi:hypothetical protein
MVAVSYEIALAIAIGGIIAGVLFRTFIPYFIKVRAEFDLAQKENRDAVMPKMSSIWLYMAGINVVVVGFPMFATIDQFVKPIIEATSLIAGFFIVVSLAMASQEVLFRLADTGIVAPTKTETTQPSG